MPPASAQPGSCAARPFPAAAYDLLHPAPVVAARRLEVPDFDRNLRFAADLDRFVEALRERVGLAADVCRVHTPVTRRNFRERDQLRRARERRRRVDQRGRDAERALLHRLRTELLHLLQLLRYRLHLAVTEHGFSQARGADEGAQVDRRVPAAQEAGDVVPVDGQLVLVEPRPRLGEDGRRHRRRRLALAGDLGGDALPHFRFDARIDQSVELAAMLANSAYTGTAMYGRRRSGPRRADLRRPRRLKPGRVRSSSSTYRTEPSEQHPIAVPALVTAELFEAVREQLAENLQRRLRRGGFTAVCGGQLGHAQIYTATGERRLLRSRAPAWR